MKRRTFDILIATAGLFLGRRQPRHLNWPARVIIACQSATASQA